MSEVVIGKYASTDTIPPGRVAAAGIAEKYLSVAHHIETVAWVSSVGSVHQFTPSPSHPNPTTSPEFLNLISTITRDQVDSFAPIRCPDKEAAAAMTKVIEQHRDAQDSIGGTVTCVIRNVPIGLGEPCFDKLEAMLAHAMLSIPATKGFEIGSGFLGCEISGSKHNDPFILDPATGRLTTRTNNSGGIQGGISNGAPIFFKVAFKPPATIGQQQATAGYDGVESVLEAKGRHDPCVVPRAVPIVEAMASLVVMDMLMQQEARQAIRSKIPMTQKGMVLPVEKSGTNADQKDVQEVLNGVGH